MHAELIVSMATATACQVLADVAEAEGKHRAALRLNSGYLSGVPFNDIHYSKTRNCVHNRFF